MKEQPSKNYKKVESIDIPGIDDALNSVSEERKRLLIEMMKEDEKNGMYEKSDNELIAEFMGAKVYTDWGLYLDNTYYKLKHGKPTNDSPLTFEDIEHNRAVEQRAIWNPKYDTSWDWLMPVVQAIEDLEEPHPSNDPTKSTVWPYQVEILSRSVVQIIDNRNDESIVLVDDQDHRKIDSVYKAVVQFIKWYNNSQQHERK